MVEMTKKKPQTTNPKIKANKQANKQTNQQKTWPGWKKNGFVVPCLIHENNPKGKVARKWGHT